MSQRKIPSEFKIDRLNEIRELMRPLNEECLEMIEQFIVNYLDNSGSRKWREVKTASRPIILGRRHGNRSGKTGYDLLSKIIGVAAVAITLGTLGYVPPYLAHFAAEALPGSEVIVHYLATGFQIGALVGASQQIVGV